MIPERLREQIPLYVLGELPAGEVAAIEALLVRSPELRADVRECTEALATIAEESATRPADQAALWRSVLSRVPELGGTSVVSASLRSTPVLPVAVMPPRRRFFRAWPIAATVLLALNFLQLWWWSRDSRDDGAAMIAGSVAARSRPGVVHGHSSKDNGPSAGDGVSTSTAGTAASGDRTNRRSSTVGGDKDADPATLQERFDKLETDYTTLTDVVIPMLWSALSERSGESGDGESHPALWTSELRAGESGQPQGVAGLWDRVRELVAQQGVAVMPDRWRLAGGVVVDPAWWTGGGTATASGVTPDPGLSAPFAMALVNTGEGVGYLDLYDMPTVTAGQELTLWMQSKGQAGYDEVGTLPPSLVGGSGGLAFRVPVSGSTPSRFMITIEPAGGTVTQPSGPVVIEGP